MTSCRQPIDTLLIQPGDEWKLEQGLVASELPLRDQTLSKHDAPDGVHSDDESSDGDAAKADGIARDDDPDVTFAEEREGWHG